MSERNIVAGEAAQRRGAGGGGGGGGERLLALLDRQRELLGQLDALSQRQSALIRSGDTDALLAVLQERQGLVDQVQANNAMLEPLRAAWAAHAADAPDREREHVRARLDALAALAGAIAARDETDREALASRRDRAAAELGNVGKGRAAMAAYGGPEVGAGPKFQDREA